MSATVGYAAARHASRRSRGFTLFEAILVIALTSIVAAMVAVFITRPVNAYVDQARRAELSDSAETALRRLARELAQALPNSARVATNGAITMIEFLPVKTSGRYRAAPRSGGSGDALDFDDAGDDSFDVLGTAVSIAAGDQLVIYNQGLPGADAYNPGESRRALTSIGDAQGTLTYDLAGAQFPFPSPGHRFQVVNSPVSYVCVAGAGGTGTLRRYSGYAIQASQPLDPAAAPLAGLSGRDNSLVADKVENCSFAADTTASTRSGLITLRVQLASGGERISLLNQVHVDNSP